MNNFQFRTNWRGQLVLQRQWYTRVRWGDKNYYWQDADTTDLQDYYKQLYELQNSVRPNTTPTGLGCCWPSATC